MDACQNGHQVNLLLTYVDIQPMRKPFVRAGLILIILGIVMVVAGIGLTSDYLTVSHTFTIKNSMYDSREMNITANDGFIGLEGNATFYLIKSSDLSLVNSSNIKQYSLPGIGNNSFGYSTEFLEGKGSYYLVSITRPQSGTAYSFTSNFGTFTDLGVILLIGLLVIGVSFIILVVGMVMRSKKPPSLDNESGV